MMKTGTMTTNMPQNIIEKGLRPTCAAPDSPYKGLKTSLDGGAGSAEAFRDGASSSGHRTAI